MRVGLLSGFFAVWSSDLFPMRAFNSALAPIQSLSCTHPHLRISAGRILKSPKTSTHLNLTPISLHQHSLFTGTHNTSCLPLWSKTLRITMADDKGAKQATLGYVRDSQSTIGCVVMALGNCICIPCQFS